MQLNFVIHRIEDKYFVETDEINHDLLNTIRFPKLLNHLNERLPAANYSPLKTKQFINKKVNQKYRYKSEQEFSDENNFKNINAMIQKIEKNKEYLKSIIENRKPEKFAPLYDDDIFFIKSIGEKFKNENLEKYSEKYNKINKNKLNIYFSNLLHLPQIEGLKRIEDVQKKSNLRRLPKLLC